MSFRPHTTHLLPLPNVSRLAFPAAALACLLTAALAPPANAQQYEFLNLASFSGPFVSPNRGLVEDAQGNLFGTTQLGGADNDGTVFEYSPGVGLTTLASLGGDAGNYPLTGLTADGQGNLFGTTTQGGDVTSSGALFEYTPGSGVTVLADFAPEIASDPLTTLLINGQGDIFGAGSNGGNEGNNGALFEYTPGSGLTNLAGFSGDNGSEPQGDIAMDPQGDIFGTDLLFAERINRSVAIYPGSLFEYTPGVGTQTLAAFTGADNGPQEANLEGAIGGVYRDAQGDIFGTSEGGGVNAAGTLFEYTPGAGLDTLFSFGGAAGVLPESSLVANAAGDLFGTTADGGAYGHGTLFEYTPGVGVSTLASFADASPTGDLTLDARGDIFGVSGNGIFELAAVPEPSPLPLLALGLIPVALLVCRKRRGRPGNGIAG